MGTSSIGRATGVAQRWKSTNIYSEHAVVLIKSNWRFGYKQLIFFFFVETALKLELSWASVNNFHDVACFLKTLLETGIVLLVVYTIIYVINF